MMVEKQKKKGVMDLSPVEIYMLLPRTNCKKCNEENCMAFAVKLVNRETDLGLCTPVFEEKNTESLRKLEDLLAPVVKEVTIGVGERAVKIGGKLVMYRHEFSYHNPTPIAIDVTDDMKLEDDDPDKEGLLERVKKIESFSYDYIGRTLYLDMVAVRSVSKNRTKFKSTVENVVKTTSLPLVLCTFQPNIMEAGLVAAHEKRPLIYAATKDNWREMADLALSYNCPLAIFVPNDLALLKSLSKTLLKYGIKDLVLDPGTFTGEGFSDTINNLTMIRRNAFKGGDTLFGFPLIGTPITSWFNKDGTKEDKAWREAYSATLMTSRYADMFQKTRCSRVWTPNLR
jgi:acetyl-CoA decarbonylase/synthase complex subunit gamma